MRTIFTDTITSLPFALPIMVDDDIDQVESSIPFTKRQIIRERKLRRKVLDHQQILEIIKKTLPASTVKMKDRKRLLTFPDQSRRPQKQILGSSSYHQARECFTVAINSIDVPLERWISDELDKVKSELTELSLSLNQYNVSLPHLYLWLDSQSCELVDKQQSFIANALIRYAQKCSEAIALERTLKFINTSKEKISQADINKSLSCASIIDYPMEPDIRYRLAAVLWRRKIALRPK